MWYDSVADGAATRKWCKGQQSNTIHLFDLENFRVILPFQPTEYYYSNKSRGTGPSWTHSSFAPLKFLPEEHLNTSLGSRFPENNGIKRE